MDKFNRALQRELLLALYESSPNGIAHEVSYRFQQTFGGRHTYIANLNYLEGHGLITPCTREISTGAFGLNPQGMKITSKGIDFIRDDGGLSAILNVHTIKFHKDAVIVLEDLIAISNMSDVAKEKAKSTLTELSTEALKTVVQAAASAGLSMLSQN